ncbi:callose synthase 7 [Citrus sinensis]|uniref:callose synthase 7-like isoform X2 n=1 Tax=Citrus sinensis TaxID=2711 RepID=UPI0003D79233|nr:callose synthase 7-like isoform X2 [Citrus sinensis]KAH9706027.1 callose synthase 7 [Citrus sinensis]
MASSSGTQKDGGPPPRTQSKKTSRAQTNVHNEDGSAIDSELVPSSLAFISPILRVASEIEKDNPRVAYLCRFHALDKAHRMDPTSSGRGVRQFKTYLLHKLEKEEEETKCQLARNNRNEIIAYYRNFYNEQIKGGQYTKKPEEMAKILQTAVVLYDVLETVVPPETVDDQIHRYAQDVQRKREQYEHYNILPLNAVGAKAAIMELPEIKAALHALRDVQNLPMPSVRLATNAPHDLPEERNKSVFDILDWLSSVFGFQKGNIANQREHLILLLANMDVRKRDLVDYTQLRSSTVQNLMDKIFKNYWSWCKYLCCEQNNRVPPGSDKQQLQLIYIGLYLLIWGEASNIRFMPECICYIFHNMADVVYGILLSNVHPVTGDTNHGNQTIAPDEETFLQTVITPIYQVLQKEAKRNKGGKASHSRWRNYDDLNEYFWSRKCFSLKWPMDPKADFFVHSDVVLPSHERPNQVPAETRKPKTNFVEARTFWHLYRSFDRMWIFFIMAFQAMVIVAWTSDGSPAAVFDEDVFRSVLTIFITQAFLNLLQAALDIVLSFNAWRSLKCTQILRYLLKFAVAAVWAVILPIWQSQGSLYNFAVAIYLVPNILAAFLFFLPQLSRIMEQSNSLIVRLFMWWGQPKLYVGRDLHEGMFQLLKYTLFWILLLICKLPFSYYVEILPLIRSSKLIMKLHVDNYEWHEFFPNVTHNIGVVIAIWAPIVLVYFMDTQIWYSIFSTLFGGINGALSHLGEIQTLGMLRSRFESVPTAFCRCLVPSSDVDTKRRYMDESTERRNIANFSHVWNKFIESMREEDLISNEDRDLLLVPYSSNDVSVTQWPPFLLASKIHIALDMAKDFKEKEDTDLFRKIKNDGYMHSAVIECYETLREIIYGLLEDETDRNVVKQICYNVDISIQQHRFLNEFRMAGMPSLCEKLEKFVKLLLSKYEDVDVYKSQIINFLQDIMKIILQDIMVNGFEILERFHTQIQNNDKEEQIFEKLNITIMENKSWREKVVRLHFLLTVKESAVNVPTNLDARRRITFFANSLFMKMPSAPKVRDMISFSVLTPYYREDVLYSVDELNNENEDGISTLFYLQKIYPDEWKNLQKRINDPKFNYSDADKEEATCHWASYRGQTLSRTVRGMMYYKQALELQCFLESAGDNAIFGGYRIMESSQEDERASAQALVNMKFTYVASCQIYGAQKKSDDWRDRSCYKNILHLMIKYPSLRVAYLDEREEIVNGKSQKFHYSVLLKGGDKYDEEIYRIKLPGPPTVIGEGRPENQNHAIIFTRGEALQTIDMNQDNYFEEAFKMRNVLEEFLKSTSGQREPTILGLREHIFTGSVSSLAWFISNQETSFVTISQRILVNPLRVRFYYGHPDIFDRIFHITRGGIGKASRVINYGADIYAGMNSTLRGGYITHHEYIQVGKGRDMGMNQLSLSEARVAGVNGEQTFSRDVYRLGHCFDFFRMLSFYFTTVGFYLSSMVIVLTVYVFLYGRLYLVMSGLEREILENPGMHQSMALEEALATQSVFQLGLLLVLPMVMEIGLEKGFCSALCDFIIMQLQLASVFFAFQLGTKVHYFGKTILHGSCKYRATGRGFVVYHAKFSENYRQYSRSHFVKGLELVILLVLYEVYWHSYRSSNKFYLFITLSMWFLVGSWLFAPFVFNPSGFDWQKTVDDWTDWKRWMGNRGGIGTLPYRSWESWWDEEQEHLKFSNIRGRILEIILVFRFFIYQYGIVYHLDIAHRGKNTVVYGLSWLVLVTTLLVLKMVSMGGRRSGAEFQLMFRIKALVFLGFMSVMTVLFVVCSLTISDLFACMLAFLPTGWAILLIGQVCRPLFKAIGLWDSVKELARAYEYIMGLLLFAPIAILSWFPFVSKFQTRLLFNQAFSRGLRISMILLRRKDRTKTFSGKST